MNEFIYGKEEIDYLCQKDVKMKEVIETLGMIHREADEDLFSSVIHHIVGQQISTKAQKTIYQRMKDGLGVINADTICEASDAYLQFFSQKAHGLNRLDEWVIILIFGINMRYSNDLHGIIYAT